MIKIPHKLVQDKVDWYLNKLPLEYFCDPDYGYLEVYLNQCTPSLLEKLKTKFNIAKALVYYDRVDSSYKWTFDISDLSVHEFLESQGYKNNYQNIGCYKDKKAFLLYSDVQNPEYSPYSDSDSVSDDEEELSFKLTSCTQNRKHLEEHILSYPKYTSTSCSVSDFQQS
jgi:hypothetical protein